MSKLISFFYGLYSVIILLRNAILVAAPIIILSALKFIVFNKKIRQKITLVLQKLADFWISLNIAAVKRYSPTKFEIKGDIESLEKNSSYLIVSNHRSWLDTLVLQYVFDKKIPFLRFFMKFQMFYIPLVGLICWALEFPAMKRYSKDFIKKHPQKKGEDILRTKEYCSKISDRNFSIVNFAEGTRFTHKKAENSNYNNLLNPKAGGLAICLENLREKISHLIDVTIIYEDDDESLWKFISRKTRKIVIDVNIIDISKLPYGDYFNNDADKKIYQDWINQIWNSKSEKIEYYR